MLRVLKEPQYLGEYLVKYGFISESQLHLALADQQELSDNNRLGDILILRGWITQEVLDHFVAGVVERKRQRARRELKRHEQDTFVETREPLVG